MPQESQAENESRGSRRVRACVQSNTFAYVIEFRVHPSRGSGCVHWGERASGEPWQVVSAPTREPATMLRILTRKSTLQCRPRLLLTHLHTTARAAADRPNKPFLTAYDAKAVEQGWYEWWEREGFFKPATARSTDDNKNFTVITPPPNVTGSLHIGHALTLSIEDALVRYRRMNGFNVEWIPGTDHAGIGTQSVVEKMLMKERQLTRHDMSREEFVAEIWKWRQKYGDRILNQMRRMGASVNWDNVFFTMDKSRSEAVQNAFIQLYKDGLVYRDTRLVNWCCALETVISDIEVINGPAEYIPISAMVLRCSLINQR